MYVVYEIFKYRVSKSGGIQEAQMCRSEELTPKDLFPKIKSAGTVRPINGPATYHGHGCKINSSIIYYL